MRGRFFSLPRYRRIMFAKIKKYLAAVIVLVCFVSFFVTAFGYKDRDVITIAFWGTNKPYENSLKEVAEQYNKSQDKYKVVTSNQAADSYRTWMGARLAGGNAPEILATTSVYANADADNGYLCDLSPYLGSVNPYNDTGESWADDFTGTYLTQVAYASDTSMYFCIPTSTVSVRIIVNVELLRENGIEIPTSDWTFSEYRKICEKLEKTGKFPAAMQIANQKFINYMVSWIIDIFMAQVKYDDIVSWDENENGQVETEEIVRLFQSSYDAYDISKDEDFANVMKFIKAWSKYFGENFNSRDDVSESFLRGQVPMLFSGSWGVAGIELTLDNENPDADASNPYKKFEYISLPFPRLEKTNYIDESTSFEFPSIKENLPLQELGEPSNCYCIPKSAEDSGKLEGAVDFLRYFTSKTVAGQMADSSYTIPVTSGVSVNPKMTDFLPPENSESIKMRFNLLNLADGVAEEYHFKQVQMYLMDGKGGISLKSLLQNVQNKYFEVTERIKDDNEWEM